MPGIARVGIDTAGGIILGGGNSTVYIDGALAAVIGDAVAYHSLHGVAVMVGGSNSVFINGIGVCRAGDAASCGHTATGSSDAFAN